MRPRSPLLAAALFLAGFAACRGEQTPAEPRAAATSPTLDPPAPAPSVPARKPVGVAPVEAGKGAALVLGRAGERAIALVVDADTKTLRTLDLDAGTELAATHLEGSPSQVLLLGSGQVVVALRDRASVALYEFDERLDARLVPVASTSVPAEPVALAAAGDAVLVVSRWAAKLATVGLPPDGAFAVRATRDLAADPAAIAVSKGKAWIHHASGGLLEEIDLAATDPVAATAHRIATVEPGQFSRFPVLRHVRRMEFSFDDDGISRPRHHHHHVRLPPPVAGPPTKREGTQGFAVVADPEGRIYAPIVLAAPAPPERPGVSVGYGGGGGVDSTPPAVGEIAVVDPDGKMHVRAVPAGMLGSSDCLLPRAAAVDAKRSQILVACAGLDALIAYDTKLRSPHDQERFRAKVGGGPTAVALDEARARAYVWSAFDGVVTTVDLAARARAFGPDASLRGDALTDPTRPIAKIVVRKTAELSAEVELGRRLFHDASPSRRISADGRACASCHPDGRADGLTWRTTEGPRQTPILLGRIEGTAPYGWNGDLPLEKHFQRTLGRLGGQGVSDAERGAIFAYVAHLGAPAAPASDPLVRRGGEVFASAEAGCATCHQGEVGTDGLTHRTGKAAPGELPRPFDTPSLRHLAQSAPYFHDGRYATLESLLTGSDGTMGHTSHLGETDRRALLAYLRAL